MTTTHSAPLNPFFIMLAAGDGADLYPFAVPAPPFLPPSGCSPLRRPSRFAPPNPITAATELLTTSPRPTTALPVSAHAQFPQ